MIVDDHAHIFIYNDNKKIEENIEKNVKYIIENATDIGSINQVIEESKRYDIIYYALGLYPEIIENMEEDQIEKILNFIENNKDKKFVAIGEVGLDYAHEINEELVKKQKIYFERFLEISEKIKKPIIIHARRAESDVLEMLSSYNTKKVLHSFWKPSLVNKAIDLGCYLSIPAIVYRDEGFQKILKEAPIELITTETDAPYLDPIEKRKLVNNSWKVVYSIKKISEIKNMDEKEVEDTIYNNFIKLYDIYDE
ncbi:Tat-linked quality control protein TatD [Nanobdella aerobiophila]|uniref:Tat-linked quality control protein TatD n=1 Tax=Nanobdella aerobiophila TaxID=2586965 RepID=A0A915SFX3_9ARCH|nr:TatD family hydrolase [Nanobdella aerobiophila]BBL45689.1 Tat-linked quality control protein TatD [Nanobdella aerobiophila]